MTIISLSPRPALQRDDPLFGAADALGLRELDGFRTVPALIRTGTRHFSVAGPAGSNHWHRSDRARERYQTTLEAVVPEAIVRVNGIDVRCHRATMAQLRLLDASFALVPPDHLQRVVAAKPEGFHMVEVAGRGSSASMMGGLNPAHDYAQTSYDETRSILITYGALWQNHLLGICPTVFHEIGHVLTHPGNGLGYGSFTHERAAALRTVVVSRNRGAEEGLCNAYMYMICYGAESAAIRAYGNGHGIQADAVTREALRQSPAFSRLPADWQARYAER